MSLAAEVLTDGAWEHVPRAGLFYTWPGSYIFPLAFSPRLRDTWPGHEQLSFGSLWPPNVLLGFTPHGRQRCPLQSSINRHFSLSLKRGRRLEKGTSIKRGKSENIKKSF